MQILRRAIFGTIFLLSLTAILASADDDPPGRVARLQYMAGSVSVQPRGTEDWVGGSLNRPLTTADNIWTDKDSRAELNIGTAILRADDQTSLTLTNISDNTVQVQLHQGVLNLRVRRLYGGEIYEIDTPNIAFTLQKSGEYRFDVSPEGDVTLVTVWKGEGDATGDGPAVRIRSHQRARFTGGNSLAHEIYEAPSYDGFDDWCRVRDRREDHSVSARYVSPGVIGYEDLDEYGTWRVVPTYGTIWVPTVVSTGWAPYRYGHWVWISPWGWTWVDDASWGFAPFHYGRWVYYGGYWGWAPGPRYVRPVYAPALVAWFGSGFGVSIGFGNGYGWCPLGYGEPYIPWYRGSRGYFRNVNVSNTRITNITYVTNNYYNYGNGDGGRKHVRAFNYSNAKAPGGVTAVDSRTIVESRPVHAAMLPVAEKDARNLNSSHLEGRVALEPTRESRLGINAGRPAVVPPARAIARPVVSRKEAPAAQPTQTSRPGRHEQGPATSEQVAGNESTPRVPARVIPRPPRAEDKGAEPATRAVGVTPRADTPGAASEARAAEPGLNRAVPRPPAAIRKVDQPSAPASPRISRNDASQDEGRSATPAVAPAVRQVPRPPTGVTSQPAVETHAIPSGPTNAVPRPTGPVSAPRDTPRTEDRGPRSPAPPSAPSVAAPSRPAMESPRPSAPAPPQQSRPVMEAPRQSAPPQSAAPRGNPSPAPSPAPSAPHGNSSSGPPQSAPHGNQSPAQHNAPSASPGPPRNN